MNKLKATFPAGINNITVNGLHQWDYGRKLKIEASDLPSIIEVHFACPGMREAVVRSCAVINNAAEAVIPDRCLEQSAPVTAWVFEINGSTGVTTKTITMPVIPRAKPQPGSTVPESYTNQYTECITQVNELVAKLGNGEAAVPYATSAGSAETAETAGKADQATNDSEGNDIPSTYAKITDLQSGDVIPAKAETIAPTTDDWHPLTVTDKTGYYKTELEDGVYIVTLVDKYYDASHVLGSTIYNSMLLYVSSSRLSGSTSSDFCQSFGSVTSDGAKVFYVAKRNGYDNHGLYLKLPDSVSLEGILPVLPLLSNPHVKIQRII